MLISIIIPVYNAETYLDECVAGILAQSFGDFELLLINDGSRDRSGELCRIWAERDSRVRFIDTPNCGVSAARNRGLEAAAGDYIAFADADDRVTPDWLRFMVDAGLDGKTLPVCSFTEQRGGRMIDFRLEDRCVEGGFEACLPLFTELYRSRKLNLVWNKLFSRAIIEQRGLRFDEHLRYGVDIVFVLEYCADIERVVTDSRPTYIYRFVPGSVSHRQIGAARLADTKNAVIETLKRCGYGEECLYLANRVYYSRLRRELRNESDPATAEILVSEILDVVRGMKKYRRKSFMRQPYDCKIKITSGITALFECSAWVRFAVRRLHL